jgi:hypothetical protein
MAHTDIKANWTASWENGRAAGAIKIGVQARNAQEDAMSGRGTERRRCAAQGLGGACGRIWRALGLGILLLGFASGAFAQYSPPPGKTIYYGGAVYDFSVNSNGLATTTQWSWADGRITSGSLLMNWAYSLGNITGCVFNGLIHGFFVKQDAGFTTLYTVTVDPVTHATTGPTVVGANIGGDYNHGVAAVVSAGQIFVFVSGQYGGLGVTSSDGQTYYGFDYK